MREAMSHEEFENYLTLLSRTLQLRSGQSEAIAEELRLHLEERLDELTDRGVDPKKAVNIALGEFGDATALANKFTEISRMKRRRVMMRSMVGGLCVAAAILAMVMTVWPQGETNFMGIAHAEMAAKEAGDNPVDLTQADRDNQETREKLKKKIDADFIECPLNELLMDMKERIGVQFYFDSLNIESVGTSSDTPISFHLKNVPADLVLRLIFKNLGLSYYIDSGVVIVTTKNELQKNLSVRMYDVKDFASGGCAAVVSVQPKGLMAEGRMFGASPKVPGAAGMMAGGGISVPTAPLSKTSTDDLIDMITCVIDPETWQQVGGPGTISPFRGILIVRQTESVHEEIGKLLDQLRDKLRQSSSQQPSNTPQQISSPGMMMGGGMPGMSMGGGMAGGMPGMMGGAGMGAGRSPQPAKPEEAK